MDWLQLVAETVKAIVWPLVTLVVFFNLRKPLRALVPFLEELRYKDFVLKPGRVGKVHLPTVSSASYVTCQKYWRRA